ncbi:MAG: TetR/AcrR family transcriptional regulator [Acutalibacteraceae bacterium]
MNPNFMLLEESKRNKLINAGFKVFSHNSYKKSPMNEIAAEAGISKSLLFYYFKNKKELFLFLVKYSAEITAETFLKNRCYEQGDFFDVFYSALKVKTDLIRQYPDIALFEMRAYFEKEPCVQKEVIEIISGYSLYEYQMQLIKPDPNDFIEGLDLQMMYQTIYLSAEGYLYEKLYQGVINVDEIEKELSDMIDFWRSVYARK